MENLNINNQNHLNDKGVLSTPRMLPIKAVIDLTSLRRTTIYDMLDKKSKRYDPTFPIQVKISEGRVVWVESEIAQWLEDKMAARFN